MSDEEPSSLDVTPQAMLAEVADEVRTTDDPPDKALVLLLWDEGNNYATSFRNAGLSCSQALALLEVMKQTFLREMTGRRDDHS